MHSGFWRDVNLACARTTTGVYVISVGILENIVTEVIAVHIITTLLQVFRSSLESLSFLAVKVDSFSQIIATWIRQVHKRTSAKALMTPA